MGLPAVGACGVAVTRHWLGAAIHVLWGAERQHTVCTNGDSVLLAPVPGEPPV